MPRHNLSLLIHEARRLYYFSHLFVLKLFPLSALFLSFSVKYPPPLSTLPQKSTNGFSRGLSEARGRRRGWQLAQNGLYPSVASEDHSSVSVMVHSTNSQEHLRIHWINDGMHHTF